MTLSYRLLFNDFVGGVPMGVAAHMSRCDLSTVQKHYSFAKQCIHFHYERSWHANLLDRVALLEREPQELVDADLPEGVEPKYNSPAVEIDETVLTHIAYPGARTTTEKQCWAVGVYDRGT